MRPAVLRGELDKIRLRGEEKLRNEQQPPSVTRIIDD